MISEMKLKTLDKQRTYNKHHDSYSSYFSSLWSQILRSDNFAFSYRTYKNNACI